MKGSKIGLGSLTHEDEGKSMTRSLFLDGYKLKVASRLKLDVERPDETQI